MSENAERMKEIEMRKEELRIEVRDGNPDESRLEEIAKEAEALREEESEVRSKMDNITLKPEKRENTSELEVRAKQFSETGTMELRALLSTGTIAKPTKVGGINDMANDLGTIVDDVKAVPLTGNGAYVVAYKDSDATADDVTDGQNIGGTGATFKYVTINPAEWGTFDEVSNQVAKMTPLDYMNAIEGSAYLSLRAKAEEKIIAEVLKSSLLGNDTVAIGVDYLRQVVLKFKAIKGKGATKLYLCQEDLLDLGKVRGANEKKALFEVKFNPGSTTDGTITEGGLSVAFGVTEELSKGTQLFGQPQTIEMPMWDRYKIETNDGGEFFKRNMIGIRGIQTANADLCAKNGMVKISNA